MRQNNIDRDRKFKAITIAIASLSLGSLSGLTVAEVPVPTEHVGLSVTSLGEIRSPSLMEQLGLEGHKLQLREITIAPGGQIAKHSHSTRPGLVKVLNGTWTEGRASGEIAFDSNTGALLEDHETEHWFFNRGDEPATALVCDIVPDES